MPCELLVTLLCAECSCHSYNIVMLTWIKDLFYLFKSFRIYVRFPPLKNQTSSDQEEANVVALQTNSQTNSGLQIIFTFL